MLKNIFYITVILLSVKICNAQDYNKGYEDSLRKYIFSEPEKTIHISKNYIKYNREHANTEKILLGYGCLTYAFDIKNELDSVIYYSDKALQYCKTPSQIIRFKKDLAEVYSNRYYRNEALNLYNDCLELAKHYKLEDREQEIEQEIAFLSYEISDPVKEGLDSRIAAYEKAKKTKDNKKIRNNRLYLILAYLKHNKPEEALILIEEALKAAKTRNNDNLKYILFKAQAEANIQKGELFTALNSIHKAEEKAIKLQKLKYKNEIDYILATLYTKQGEYNKQITVLENIIKQDTTLLPNKERSKFYELLAKGYKEIGNIEQYILYNEKYKIEYKKEVNNNYSAIKKGHAIVDKNRIHKIKTEKTEKTNWIIALIVAIVILFALLFRHKYIQKKNKILFNELMLKIKKAEEHKALIPNKDKAEDPSLSINNTKVNEILVALKKLEDENYFLRQDCTLHNMAKSLQTNTTYLSKVINSHLHKSFSAYINELRVNYVIIELKHNKQLRAYSTRGLAQELGYKNAAAFTIHFKETTGITPAVYIRNIRKQA